MSWNELFPKDRQPTAEDMARYSGELWRSLAEYFATAYGAAPKIAYSGCGMKPGWNVKYQKSGQSFGTLYPLRGCFDVMIVISYKLDSAMELLLPALSAPVAELYRAAGDYMKMGKWMMLRIDSEQALADYKRIVSAKLPPR